MQQEQAGDVGHGGDRDEVQRAEAQRRGHAVHRIAPRPALGGSGSAAEHAHLRASRAEAPHDLSGLGVAGGNGLVAEAC